MNDIQKILGKHRSTEIMDACNNAGISEATTKRVKSYLGVKSVKEQDEWFWLL